MDSEMEERKLPSIRRPQIIFIYRKSGVDNPATFGQIVCSVRRLPIRFTVGTGGTIKGSGQTQGSAPTTPFALNFPDVWLLACLRHSRRSGCAFQPDARSLFMSRVISTTIRVVRFN